MKRSILCIAFVGCVASCLGQTSTAQKSPSLEQDLFTAITSKMEKPAPGFYYNAKPKKAGAVLTYQVDHLNRIGLDFGIMAGTASDRASLTNFTGTFGITLSGKITVPKTNVYLRGGLVGSWDNGKEFGGGIFITAGFVK
jgi:hypothetical protein